VHFPDEEHDYGLAKRMEVYHFFREVFDLAPLPPIEVTEWPPEPVKFPSQDSMHAFNEDHPRPELPKGERALAEVLRRLGETYPPPPAPALP
jgi:hypothetical protein